MLRQENAMKIVPAHFIAGFVWIKGNVPLSKLSQIWGFGLLKSFPNSQPFVRLEVGLLLSLIPRRVEFWGVSSLKGHAERCAGFLWEGFSSSAPERGPSSSSPTRLLPVTPSYAHNNTPSSFYLERVNSCSDQMLLGGEKRKNLRRRRWSKDKEVVKKGKCWEGCRGRRPEVHERHEEYGKTCGAVIITTELGIIWSH